MPTRRRYVVTNTTIEAMGVVLASNPGGVLLHRDELVGFFRSMDREGRQENRSFYLEAWAGDSRYSPSSEPANRLFFLPRAMGRMLRSTTLVSSSTRPSSRNRPSPSMWRSA